MEQNNVSKRVTATILSMSLLTVMAGAAIAPALGIIKAHFATAPRLLVQLIVSMPALLIIITNIFFLQLSRRVMSPLIVMPMSKGLFGDDITGPYKAGCLLSIVFLLQVWATRHFQSLPPQKD